MNTKVYVASHCRWAACYVAEALERNGGFTVISTWHEKEFNPTEDYSLSDRTRIAIDDAREVSQCDLLVLVAGPERYSGGKFVEAGIAMGLGKRVVVIGRRENMLLWYPSVEQVEHPRDIK